MTAKNAQLFLRNAAVQRLRVALSQPPLMPIRMAVTGSRVSPPLIGSILILGVDRSLARIEKTLASF